MIRLAALFALLLVGASSACTIGPASSSGDAGTTDANAATGTIGDQCTRIYTALCTNAIQNCGQSFQLATCVQNGETMCCVDKCSHPAITPDVTIDSCVRAVSAESCNDVVNNAIPDVCRGVPATQ